MATSRTKKKAESNVIDLQKVRSREDARAAVKALMSTFATLAAEVRRLEKVVARYGI